MTRERIQELLAPVFQESGEIVFAYLFGSFSTGEAGPLSDIDVAIYVENPHAFSLNQRLSVQTDCCRALRSDKVDLLVLNQLRNLVLLDRIVRTGALIWNRDKNLVDEFELKIMHRAMDFLNQRRREVGV